MTDFSCTSSAEDEDLSGIRLVEPGQDLHERRLARAVVADQAEHLAGPDVKRDIRERFDDSEALADVLDANRVRSVRTVRLGLRGFGHVAPPSRPDCRIRSRFTFSAIETMIPTPRMKSNQ